MTPQQTVYLWQFYLCDTLEKVDLRGQKIEQWLPETEETGEGGGDRRAQENRWRDDVCVLIALVLTQLYIYAGP